MADEKTQKTPKGHEIPVPKQSHFLLLPLDGAGGPFGCAQDRLGGDVVDDAGHRALKYAAWAASRGRRVRRAGLVHLPLPPDSSLRSE